MFLKIGGRKNNVSVNFEPCKGGQLMSITTFTGETIPIKRKNPDKDLTPTELKLYNYLRKVGPRTEIQIRKHPAFDNIADIGRALRRLRAHELPYVDSIPQREGPQKWIAML